MKTLITLTLLLALTGCFVPQETAYRKMSNAFIDICVPQSIIVNTQNTEENTMIIAVCTRIK